MSIEDDVALLERVPTLRLLGTTSLRMLAIGSEQRDFARGDVLFNAGEDADAGYIVQRGAFRIEDGGGVEIIAGPGALIGELALVVAMPRPSTAIALEYSLVIRVARSLFQRVLESDPAAARRLRDEFANRTSQIASEILMAGAKLSIYTSSVTVTGTWSDGRSQPRASLVIRKSLTLSCRARDIQMWSSRRPRSAWVQSAAR
jgi:CRP-like cAMP-binding protein